MSQNVELKPRGFSGFYESGVQHQQRQTTLKFHHNKGSKQNRDGVPISALLALLSHSFLKRWKYLEKHNNFKHLERDYLTQAIRGFEVSSPIPNTRNTRKKWNKTQIGNAIGKSGKYKPPKYIHHRWWIKKAPPPRYTLENQGKSFTYLKHDSLIHHANHPWAQCTTF